MIAPGLEPPTSVRRTRGRPRASTAGLARRAAADRRRRPRPGRLGRPDRAGRAAGAASCDDAGGGRHRLTPCSATSRRRGATSSRPSSTSYPPRWRRAWSSTTSCCSSRPPIVAGEADRVTGLRRLYVCLTRAVTSLAILHVDPLPEELGTPCRRPGRAPARGRPRRGSRCREAGASLSSGPTQLDLRAAEHDPLRARGDQVRPCTPR